MKISMICFDPLLIGICGLLLFFLFNIYINVVIGNKIRKKNNE
jgi:hypothetical protein